MAQEQTLVYLEQGGAKQVIASGGEIEVQSGATLDIQSGATLNLHGSAMSSTELGFIDGVTAGTAAASKAVVLDASKGIATITSATITTLTAPTVNATNVDAGASGAAGSVDVFPSTASKGKLTITCADQTGDTAVTVNANAMGQATAVNLADPGATTSYVCQTKLATCDLIAGGSHAATAANASAGTVSIATGLNSVLSFSVMILRSGAAVTGDAAISVSSTSLVVADGSTYTLTEADVIKWIAVGS